MSRRVSELTQIEQELIRERRNGKPEEPVDGYVPDADPRSHEDLAAAYEAGDESALELLDKRRSYITEPNPDVIQGIFDKVTTSFTRYRITSQFIGAVIGGTPKDKKLIEGWLMARAGLSDDQRKIQTAVLKVMEDMGKEPEPEDRETFVEDVTSVVADEMKGNGFKRDDETGMLILETRQVKSCIRESTNVVYAGVRMGPTSKGSKSFLAENLFVEGLTIPLGVTEPTLTMPFTGHVRDKSGERSTLTYYDVVWQPTIQFVIRVKNDLEVDKFKRQRFGPPRVTEEQLRAILEHAQWLGLGALRSQGAGVFRILDLTRFKAKTDRDLDTVPINEEVVDW